MRTNGVKKTRPFQESKKTRELTGVQATGAVSQYGKAHPQSKNFVPLLWHGTRVPRVRVCSEQRGGGEGPRVP